MSEETGQNLQNHTRNDPKIYAALVITLIALVLGLISPGSLASPPVERPPRRFKPGYPRGAAHKAPAGVFHAPAPKFAPPLRAPLRL